jgi:cysteine desulfurase
MIYFDHNATTPLDSRVLDAMLPYLKSFYGNPSSLYRQGRIVRSAIDNAREQIASLVDAPAAQIIFTSGGTEANNLALASLPPQGKLAISAIEHPSVIEPALRFKRNGGHLDFLDVDTNGLINPVTIDKLIQTKPDGVSIMLANNETGVIQNLTPYINKFRDNHIIFHTDAVQAVGKIPVSFSKLGAHLMSLSSHKIYGPKGCGALIFEKGLEINPLLLGGGQEQSLRAGTENVAAIIGFGKAAELAQTELNNRQEKLLTLRLLLETNLTNIPGLIIFALQTPRLPNTVQFGIHGVDGEMLLMQLDQKKIAVSSGSACTSESKASSHVLKAMNIEENLAKSALRISLGIENTEAEIFEFIYQLKTLVHPT